MEIPEYQWDNYHYKLDFSSKPCLIIKSILRISNSLFLGPILFKRLKIQNPILGALDFFDKTRPSVVLWEWSLSKDLANLINKSKVP